MNAQTPKLAIAAWVATLGLMLGYFEYVEPLAVMAGGLRHLDVRYGVGYTPEDVLTYFNALGDRGRAFYARTTAFDTVWPLAIAATCALWATLAFKSRRWVLLAASCPVAFGVLDLVENCGIWFLLSQFPDISDPFVRALNILTLTKQAMIPGWVVSFILCPLIYTRRVWREKHGPQRV